VTHPTKCMIVSHNAVAQQLQNLLGPDWYVISAGHQVCGRMFDLIVFTQDWDFQLTAGAAADYVESIRHRIRDKHSIVVGA
jgi:hypothetical protein